MGTFHTEKIDRANNPGYIMIAGSWLIRVIPLVVFPALGATPAAMASHTNPASQIHMVDTNGDGSADKIHRTAYEYNAKGRLEKREVHVDLDADGVVDRIESYSYVYDDWGRPAQWLYGLDVDADGTPDTWQGREWWNEDNARRFRKWKGGPKDGSRPEQAEGWDRYEYIDPKDGTRNFSRINWYDRDGDGTPELRRARQRQYDPDTGRLVESNKGTDTDGVSPWEYYVKRFYMYGEDGNSYDYVSEIIRNGVVVPGPWGGATKSYGEKGQLQEESRWKGVGDGATSSTRTWYTYEYDDRGRVIRRTRSEDLLGPPDAERWNEWTRTYHGNGRLKESINKGWWNAVIDRTNEIQWIKRYTFDEKGNVLTLYNDQADIVANTRQLLVKEFTYDEAYRVIRAEETRSRRPDGRIQFQSSIDITRDSEGRMVELVKAIDEDGDGRHDRVTSRSFEYP